uniref:hypothetical protein n=1 Tax=Alistipes sp. TaxID=1872444 RepID=UPI00405716C8
MKKLLFLAALAMTITSCSVQQVQRTQIIPKAISTVNTASFNELNLERADYEILNTLTAEAVINRSENNNGTKIKIEEANGEFHLNYQQNNFGSWECKYSGIVKLGYLANDYNYEANDLIYAENIARRLAIYRLINLSQEYGADGIIEPTVAIAVEQIGDTIIYKATVVAKIVKLKTDN